MKVAEKLLKNTEAIISNDQLKAPIYNNTDLERALKEFRACEYGEFIQVTGNIKVMFIQNQDILLSHIIFSHYQMYKLPHLIFYNFLVPTFENI